MSQRGASASASASSPRKQSQGKRKTILMFDVLRSLRDEVTGRSPQQQRRLVTASQVQREHLRIMVLDLYPLTKHNASFVMPATLKMSYQTKHFIKRHSVKAQELERRCKQEVLRSLLQYTRKRYIISMRHHYLSLKNFIEANQSDLAMERSRLLLSGQGAKMRRMSIYRRNRYLTSFLDNSPHAPRFSLALSTKELQVYLDDFFRNFNLGLSKLDDD